MSHLGDKTHATTLIKIAKKKKQENIAYQAPPRKKSQIKIKNRRPKVREAGSINTCECNQSMGFFLSPRATAPFPFRL
jgi:hypothetical protein